MIPQSIVDWIILGLLVFRGLGYWIFDYALFPDALFSVHGIFRFWGDIGYFPLIESMSHGNFGEPNLFESYGLNTLSFPFASVAPYAAFIGILGSMGFLVGDVFCVVATYFLLVTLFRTLSMNQPCSKFLALAIVSNLLPYLYVMTFGLVQVPPVASVAPYLSILFLSGSVAALLYSMAKPTHSQRILAAGVVCFSAAIFFLASGWVKASTIWGMRIPRPLVTNLYIYSSMFLIAWLWKTEKLTLRLWIVLGFTLGLALQGNLHSALVLLVMSGLLIVDLVFSQRATIWRVLQFSAAMTLTFGVTIIPFLWQRIRENPDAAVRLGMIALPRWPPLGLYEPRFVLDVIALGVIVGLAALTVKISNQSTSQKNSLFRSFRFFAAGGVACFVALPASVLLLGKTSSPEQFRDRFQDFYSLAFVVLLLDLGSVYFLKNNDATLHHKRWGRKLFLAGIMCCAASIAISSLRPAQRTSHIRQGVDEFGALGDTYKKDFIALARFLQEQRQTGVPISVLATFDVQAYAWWQTFEHGFSFLADPFMSTQPDSVIEERIFGLAKLLNFDAKQFQELLYQRFLLTFWLGHLKYQPGHLLAQKRIAPLTPEDSQALGDLTTFDVFDFIAPSAEKKRLVEQFEKFDTSKLKNWRLDAVLLNNKGFQQQLSVTSPEFAKVFENQSFRLWVKKG